MRIFKPYYTKQDRKRRHRQMSPLISYVTNVHWIRVQLQRTAGFNEQIFFAAKSSGMLTFESWWAIQECDNQTKLAQIQFRWFISKNLIHK